MIRTWTVGLIFGMAGCGGDQISGAKGSGDTAESGVTLRINSLEPPDGPMAGATMVLIEGEGFTEGTTGAVGGADCVEFQVVSDTQLICATPAGAQGETELLVTRTEDGATATATYRYVVFGDTGSPSKGDDTGSPSKGDDTGSPSKGDDTADSGSTQDTSSGDTADSGDTGSSSPGTPEATDYCHIQWPCSLSSGPGETTEEIYVWVYESGITEGKGEGADVSVQVGVGDNMTDPDTSSSWTWTDTIYNMDKDGLKEGDLANDEYTGALTAPKDEGTYAYAGRVTVDGATSWTYCDFGGDSCGGSGTDDGYSASTTGELVVSASR